MPTPAINVPNDAPIFAIKITRIILKKRFLKNPLILNRSSETFCRSFTVGFFNEASTNPVNQPHARIGFNVVKGAATQDVSTLSGCAKDNAVNIAANAPVHKTHADNCANPVCILMAKA